MNDPDSTTAPLPREGWLAALLRHARRYMTVGAGSTVTDFTVLALLSREAGWSAVAANAVSRPCGGLFSFVANKLWTFERREARGTALQIRRFWLVWLGAYASSSLLVWLFAHYTGWSALPCKLAAESVVSPAVFFIMRHWTFRRPAA